MPSARTLQDVKSQQKVVSDLRSFFKSTKVPSVEVLNAKAVAAKDVSSKLAAKIASLSRFVARAEAKRAASKSKKGSKKVSVKATVQERAKMILDMVEERRAKLNARYQKLVAKKEAEALKAKKASGSKKSDAAPKKESKKESKKASAPKKASSKKASSKKAASPKAESPKTNLFRLFGGYDLYDSDAASEANSDLLM